MSKGAGWPCMSRKQASRCRSTERISDSKKQQGHSMTMMKAVQVGAPGAPFELVERPVPEPGAGELLIKVEACGICRGDAATKEARHAAITMPRVPGHEVVGLVVKTGSPNMAFAV